ncbi:MAG: hypothetical protein WC447_00085 [Candidatus Paceibacterota bacterium]|jgi:hypothetical protein
MNKKVLVIIILVLIVAGGLYYGVSSWQKNRAVEQMLQDTNGVGQPGTGNEETTKTPNDLFKEAKEVVLSSKTLPIFTEKVRPEIEKIFGGSKVTSYGKYSDYEGSFTAVLKVPRLVVPEDLTKLEEFYLKEGFETKTNEVSANSGTLVMSNSEGTEIEFSYYSDDQDIKVWYTPAQ